MICGATEVYLESYFPLEDEHMIVDLSDVDCEVGQNVSEIIGMNDVVFDIDNKSLTNRPDCGVITASQENWRPFTDAR